MNKTIIYVMVILTLVLTACDSLHIDGKTDEKDVANADTGRTDIEDTTSKIAKESSRSQCKKTVDIWAKDSREKAKKWVI